MNWLDRYQYQMRRTRFLGIIGASVVLLSVIAELWWMWTALSMAEGSQLLDAELRWVAIKQGVAIVVVGAIFSARIILLFSKDRPYWQIALSSAAVFVVAVTYVWYFAPVFNATEDCNDESKLCFGIYDMARADRVVTSSALYIWLSAFRMAATALYAAFKYQYK